MSTDDVKVAIKEYRVKYKCDPDIDALAKEIADTSNTCCDEADLEDALEKLEAVGEVQKDDNARYSIR